MGEGEALHHVGCSTKALNLTWFRGGGESIIHPPPLIPASAVFDPEAQTRRELVAGSREGRGYILI